jgi:hypothetical protein
MVIVTRIAIRVPMYRATSKIRLVRAVSFHPNNQGTMIRWAELEIGINSVAPWTIPNKIAYKISMVFSPLFGGIVLLLYLLDLRLIRLFGNFRKSDQFLDRAARATRPVQMIGLARVSYFGTGTSKIK